MDLISPLNLKTLQCCASLQCFIGHKSDTLKIKLLHYDVQ